MDKISSFKVDHTKLEKGVYVSRVDGDITTYDLRICKPNAGVYLEDKPLHTIEHLFATYARNSRFKDNVIYFGPMGCRTGFYFITKALKIADVLDIIKSGFRYIANYEGEIPGATAQECGNYLEHDLQGAKAVAAEYCKVLENITSENTNY